MNPPIIASATQSSPAIASICAQSAAAAWSRSAFRRARHRGDAQHRAVIPHDDQPRTRLFAHHCAHTPCRCSLSERRAMPAKLSRAVLASLICCQNVAMVLEYAIARSVHHHSFAHGSTVRANNPLSNRRRRSRTPIGLGQQHAASFNPASNRSRAELAARSITGTYLNPQAFQGW